MATGIGAAALGTPAADAWEAGPVGHLLPTVSHERILLKASFKAPLARAPALRILPVGIFAGTNSWFKPNQLIFSRSHQAWDLVADHLPWHETYRQDGDA